MKDILVVGATGYTGRLVSQYLSSHPQRAQFSFAIGARSLEKLEKLARDLGLGDDVETIRLDVTDADSVEGAVINSKVVINTVGPYWTWGANVVRACAKYGKGYVDLTAEPHWVRRMIIQYDYLATKTGAIIIPACGMDSIPSDISVYMGNRALKSLVGPDSDIESTVTCFELHGGLSGGTLSSLLTAFEEVPKLDLQLALQDYALSPAITGPPGLPSQLVYHLPSTNPTVYGSFYAMEPSNKAIVQRTWSLHQLAALNDEEKDAYLTYGNEFCYQECMKMPNALAALVISLSIKFVVLALLASPVRWLLKKVLPPGSGPAEGDLDKGRMEVLSITTSTPDDTGEKTSVRITQRGHGDPGYRLTTVAVAESALSILLQRDELPSLAHQGGILTPMSALGDVLIRRLAKTGRFEFESEMVIVGNEENRKTR